MSQPTPNEPPPSHPPRKRHPDPDPEFELPKGQDLASTHHLLEGLHQNDPAAWKEFADKYLPILYRKATRRLSLRARRLQDTCDIVQEVVAEFVQAANRVQFVHTGALAQYLVSMIRKHLADAEKASWKAIDTEPADMEQLSVPAPQQEEEPVPHGRLALVKAAQKNLTREERKAVNLSAKNLPPREIALALGRPPGDTAQTFIRRSVAKYKREHARLLKKMRESGT